MVVKFAGDIVDGVMGMIVWEDMVVMCKLNGIYIVLGDVDYNDVVFQILIVQKLVVNVDMVMIGEDVGLIVINVFVNDSNFVGGIFCVMLVNMQGFLGIVIIVFDGYNIIYLFGNVFQFLCVGQIVIEIFIYIVINSVG